MHQEDQKHVPYNRNGSHVMLHAANKGHGKLTCQLKSVQLQIGHLKTLAHQSNERKKSILK